MMQDIRVAWLFLAKRRTATAIAVVTLGIAVAISTLAVGILDQAFWRAAPVAGGAELITIYNRRPAAPQFQVLSYPDYSDIRDRLRGEVDVAAFMRRPTTLASGDAPARVWGELVSGNYFDVLGTTAVAGRVISVSDDRGPGGQPVVVIGYSLWRRSFGADPAIVGRTIRLGRFDYTVIGVAPPGFRGPAWASEYWIPLTMSAQVFGLDVLSRPDLPVFQTVARPQARLRLSEIQARVRTVETSASKDAWRLEAFPGVYLRFWPAYRATVARFLGVFVAIATCILIIACANLAGLLIARASERQRELALRQALGAAPHHLLRRLVAESLILVVFGGSAGAIFAAWGAVLIERVPAPVPIGLSLTVDVRLGAICLGVSLVTMVLFTALSSIKGLRADVRTVLVASAGTLAPSTRAQRVLVIAQVALACVMLTVGGLLWKSAWRVEGIDVGFEPGDIVMGNVGLSDQGYTPATGLDFYQRLRERLVRHAEVEAVAFEWHPPLTQIRVTGNFAQPDGATVQARYNVISAGYFKALRIPLRAGREFDDRDHSNAEPVAIVNESFASRFAADAIGQTLKLSGEPSPRRIVGIVRDVKYNGITEPPQPFAYLPMTQAFRSDLFVHVRSRAGAVAGMLRSEVRALDPQVALSDVRTLTEQADEARATPRASAIVSAGAAAIAVFLALVGLYGVLMTSVEQRRRELAIRSALGAAPRDVLARVMKEGLVLTTIGLVPGMLASTAAGSFLADLLFGVAPRDGIVMTLVPVVVLVVSALAWIAPARRAASVDPVAVLRAE
jgi:putative ABC transport system permease protein